jgi:hypothetical protein
MTLEAEGRVVATALTLAERLAAGDGDDPFVINSREELGL